VNSRAGQRGVIFVAALVLLAGMSVVVIAMVHEVSLDFRMATNLVEADQAAELARLGLDNLIYIARNDGDWRTNQPSGTWISNKSACGGSFSASGVDADGDLADCRIDLVNATATGTYGGASRTLSATLTPPIHEAMLHLAYAGGGSREIKIEGFCRIYGDLCADKVTASNGTPDHRGRIYAEKTSDVSDVLKDGNTTVEVYASRPEYPDVDLNWFKARGTRLSPAVHSSDYYIADKVISPTSNPNGFSSSSGIYYIEGDRDVRFVRCHITATIVILTGKKVYFDKACVHAPAFPYYPALVTEDELYYDFDENLSEADRDVDFNGDGDKADTFTPSVSGVVYAKKKIVGLQYGGGTNIVRFKGLMISDKIEIIGPGSIFEQDPDLASTLVNQFQGEGLELVTGSVTTE
jgi:hypothetical protein